MPSTFEVGQKLITLCREKKNIEAVNTLYAANIVSIEAMAMDNMPARMEGIDAIRKKNQWWMDNHTIHSSAVSGPFPHGDRFVVYYNYDVTANTGPMAGQRMQMEEAALYTVKDGKVAQEEFFYHMG